MKNLSNQKNELSMKMSFERMSEKWPGLKTVTYSLVLFLILNVIACSNSNPPPVPKASGVVLQADPNGGNFITDNLGNTLYFFAQDFAGQNTCQGTCATAWPVFYVSNITIGTGLDQADFGEITNSSGDKQSTFKGWPLYRYSGDKKAGDKNGDNVGGVWFFAKADYAVMVGVNPTNGKKYLVAPKGRTLYTFDNDVNLNVATCTGNCANTWPPYLKTIANIVVPSLLTATNFGTTTGGQQFIYKGHPLYYNVNDVNRGDANGLANPLWHELDETRF